jgi:hypothetical protein
MYRIRFNLGRGQNYKKWKILNTSTKEVIYLNPNEVSIHLSNATLCNRKEAAKRINEGHNKYVCSWIEVESFSYFNFSVPVFGLEELMYNPRVTPFWRDALGNDVDGFSFEELVTVGNKVYKL